MWNVYILLCRDGSLYTGTTNDVEKRLKVHNNKKGAKSIRGRLPAKLVYLEKLTTRGEALRREAEIKRLRREKKIALISNGS